MSALFYIVKAICWLLIGVTVDIMLDSVSVVDRFPTILGVCAGVFIFEMLMDTKGGNTKLRNMLQDR